MTDLYHRVRPARPADAADAAKCWEAAFGDGPDFVRDMLASAALLENAAVAEAEGGVRSVMFAFDGLDFAGTRMSYLYALCTLPEYRGRGMGAAVCLALARQCFDRGAELVCLSPASEGLERWYRKKLHMRVLQRSVDVPGNPADGGAACARIGAAEYLRLRAGKNGLALTPRLLAAQEAIYRHYGGGMFQVSTDGKQIALACAEPREDSVLVRELLCAEKDRPAALGVISAAFSGKPPLVRTQSRRGRALLYLTPDGGAFPGRPGSPFPFTLE